MPGCGPSCAPPGIARPPAPKSCARSAASRATPKQSLQQIAETTARLFGASSVTILVADGDSGARSSTSAPSSKRIGAEVPAGAASDRRPQPARRGLQRKPADPSSRPRQCRSRDGRLARPALRHAPPAAARISGTPLRREGQAIGALIVHRDRLVPFTAEELALQQSFADQAAIAIENARLFNETRQALERQTASAEILRAIAHVPATPSGRCSRSPRPAPRLFGGSQRVRSSSSRTANGVPTRTASAPARNASAPRADPRRMPSRRPKPAGHGRGREPANPHSRISIISTRDVRLARPAPCARRRHPHHVSAPRCGARARHRRSHRLPRPAVPFTDENSRCCRVLPTRP